jgi:hypothetical protein
MGFIAGVGWNYDWSEVGYARLSGYDWLSGYDRSTTVYDWSWIEYAVSPWDLPVAGGLSPTWGALSPP